MANDRDFAKVTVITFITYFVMCLMYYSQIYLMEDYFSGTTIFAITDGWAYLMQALGMIVMIFICSKDPIKYGNRKFAAGLMVAMFPVLVLSVLVKNGVFIFAMMLVLNFLIGFETAFYFGLMVQYLSAKWRLMSFAVAYAIGTIAMWALSKVSPDVLTSNYIIFVDAILILINIYLFFSFKDLGQSCDTTVTGEAPSLMAVIMDNKVLIAVVFLMSVLSVLGSSDNVALTTDIGLSLLDIRVLYGVGLIICAWIYAKSRNIGGIVTMASLVLPFIALGLLHFSSASAVVCLITFIALGFYAVYRAGVFMDITSDLNLIPVFAAFGLAISRISDAVTVISFTIFYPAYYPISFLVSGIVLIPLMIFFFMLLIKKAPIAVDEDAKRSDFAEKYQLTRREEEIAQLISQGKSNGEIASSCHLSESTVRFHVSNILKKTGLKNRSDVSRAYHKSYK